LSFNLEHKTQHMLFILQLSIVTLYEIRTNLRKNNGEDNSLFGDYLSK